MSRDVTRKDALRGQNAQMGLRILVCSAAAICLLLVGRMVEGHAILKESNPAANSSLAGPDIPIRLKFNVRIDAGRSKLQLLHPDNTVSDLPIEKQANADTLTSKATGLKPGTHSIRWQVLAPDGHITRGEIPFKVTGS
jgi:methionine-rich copper-binding protein CopC